MGSGSTRPAAGPSFMSGVAGAVSGTAPVFAAASFTEPRAAAGSGSTRPAAGPSFMSGVAGAVSRTARVSAAASFMKPEMWKSSRFAELSPSRRSESPRLLADATAASTSGTEAAGAGASGAEAAAAPSSAASAELGAAAAPPSLRATIRSTSVRPFGSSLVKRTVIPARTPPTSAWLFTTTPSPVRTAVPSERTSSNASGVPSGLGSRVAMNMPPRATLGAYRSTSSASVE